MPSPQFPIIDTHQHLWDPAKIRLPWLDGAGPPLAARHWTEEYDTATEGMNIETAMYMEVDAAPEQKMQEARNVLELIASGKSRTRCAILCANPGSDGFRRFVDVYRNHGAVRGFRQVLHGGSTPPGYCVTPKFIANCHYFGALGKTFDLCLRPKELSDAVKLAAACPDTRFILDHCGNADPKAFFASDDPRRGQPDHDADQWRQDMADLAKHENVFCKISGIVAPRTARMESRGLRADREALRGSIRGSADCVRQRLAGLQDGGFAEEVGGSPERNSLLLA